MKPGMIFRLQIDDFAGSMLYFITNYTPDSEKIYLYGCIWYDAYNNVCEYSRAGTSYKCNFKTVEIL